jgi:hypothetical protein
MSYGRELALTLLVLRIALANDPAHDLACTIAAQNEATVLADLLAGGADFHAAEGVVGLVESGELGT